jgi:selenocysteine-specific elongation factor
MRSIVIGTAGHIDHGKSALVRALTGIDPDRLKEERERGITIDLGFAHLETGEVNLAFVDVPGHERFVKNMLAGAGGIDLVMLVIAADESVMPQTREHFQICRLLQIPAGVIVLTKADLVDRETIDLVTLEARELTDGSFLADAPVIAVSSKTVDGVDRLLATLVTLATDRPARTTEGPVRLPIDRVFSVKGFGTVVTGTLVSGVVREEQELVALPGGLPVKVRGLQVHGRAEASADAGRRVAVNVGGADVADLARGETLCEPGAFEPSRRIDAVLDLLPDARPLQHGARVRFHHGTTELLGRVAVAGPRGASRDREPGAGQSRVDPGSSAYVRIRLEAPAVVTRGDRFILRAYSPPVTVGGGAVLDPRPPRGPIRTRTGFGRFARLDSPDGQPEDALVVFVEERGALGFRKDALVTRAGLSRSAAKLAVARLVAGGHATIVDELLVAPQVVTGLAARLVKELQAHHAAQPLSEGLPREEARERLFSRAAPALFEFIVDRLVTERKLVARERLALDGHQVSLSPEEARTRDALERIFREAGLQPPDLATAAAAAGASPDVADRIAKLLLRSRTLVRIESLVFHAEALERLKVEVRSLKEEGGTARVDIGSFKERYGMTRKYAIPLLEYLDRERVTRRVGESRVVL